MAKRKNKIIIKEEAWMIELMKTPKTKMTLQEILTEVKKHEDHFLSQVKEHHIITHLNGFVAVGVLIKPRDHLTPGVNPIWLYSCGSNKDGSKIIKIISATSTVEEAEDTIEVLKVCLERFNDSKCKRYKVGNSFGYR